jgi:nodulation protein E
MGAITAAGVGVGALWAAARAGRSGIGEAKLSRDGPNRVKLAAQVPGFEPEQFIESSRLPFCDRFAQLAIAAATEALTQAGLPRSDKLGQRTAVIIGTGVGGITRSTTSYMANMRSRTGQTHGRCRVSWVLRRRRI